MNIHHLNAATMCPLGTTVIPGDYPRKTVCHSLLVETGSRLVLVDTGLGTRDLKHLPRLGPLRWVMNPKTDPGRTALGGIRELGFYPDDVTDIVVTHLDLDHAGGIDDFPKAQVHVHSDELQAARARNGIRGCLRYRPEQLATNEQWSSFDFNKGVPWYGFDSVRRLGDLPPDILAVRLPGHTPGHVGIALDTDDGWLLHAGDTYYDRDELHPKARSTLFGRIARWFIHDDCGLALKTLDRLRACVHDPDLRIFCSHDPDELSEVQ